jgi:hypothetical protein
MEHPHVAQGRRRELLIGIVVMLLATFTVAQSIYFQTRQDAAQACVERKFGELSEVLSARAAFSAQESDATKAVIESFVNAAAAQSGTQVEIRKARAVIIKKLQAYDRTSKRIDRLRKENPVPDYPVGTCDAE